LAEAALFQQQKNVKVMALARLAGGNSARYSTVMIRYNHPQLALVIFRPAP
jgi:hypothetical protein